MRGKTAIAAKVQRSRTARRTKSGQQKASQTVSRRPARARTTVFDAQISQVTALIVQRDEPDIVYFCRPSLASFVVSHGWPHCEWTDHAHFPIPAGTLLEKFWGYTSSGPDHEKHFLARKCWFSRPAVTAEDGVRRASPARTVTKHMISVMHGLPYHFARVASRRARGGRPAMFERDDEQHKMDFVKTLHRLLTDMTPEERHQHARCMEWNEETQQVEVHMGMPSYGPQLPSAPMSQQPMTIATPTIAEEEENDDMTENASMTQPHASLDCLAPLPSPAEFPSVPSELVWPLQVHSHDEDHHDDDAASHSEWSGFSVDSTPPPSPSSVIDFECAIASPSPSRFSTNGAADMMVGAASPCVSIVSSGDDDALTIVQVEQASIFQGGAASVWYEVESGRENAEPMASPNDADPLQLHEPTATSATELGESWRSLDFDDDWIDKVYRSQ